MCGTLAAFDAMTTDAHAYGMRVIVDLVPNHTSSAHAWFREALAARPGDPARERYIFRDGKGPDGAEPPNDWESIFGGVAWTRVPDGQWYLHIFDPSSPTSLELPAVRAEFGHPRSARRCVDGFRVDVAPGLVRPGAAGRRLQPLTVATRGERRSTRHPSYFDRGVQRSTGPARSWTAPCGRMGLRGWAPPAAAGRYVGLYYCTMSSRRILDGTCTATRSQGSSHR